MAFFFLKKKKSMEEENGTRSIAHSVQSGYHGHDVIKTCRLAWSSEQHCTLPNSDACSNRHSPILEPPPTVLPYRWQLRPSIPQVYNICLERLNETWPVCRDERFVKPFLPDILPRHRSYWRRWRRLQARVCSAVAHVVHQAREWLLVTCRCLEHDAHAATWKASLFVWRGWHAHGSTPCMWS